MLRRVLEMAHFHVPGAEIDWSFRDYLASPGTGGGTTAEGGPAAPGGRGAGAAEFRNFSPDSSMFAFARDFNLYVVKVATKDTVQLSRDGAKYYSFGARDTLNERLQQELTRQGQNQNQDDNVDDGSGGVLAQVILPFHTQMDLRTTGEMLRP